MTGKRENIDTGEVIQSGQRSEVIEWVFAVVVALAIGGAITLYK